MNIDLEHRGGPASEGALASADKITGLRTRRYNGGRWGMGEHGSLVKLERDTDERSADGSDRTGDDAHP